MTAGKADEMGTLPPSTVARVRSGPAQLVLDLPHRTARGAEDFLVSPSNEAAVELVDAWPNWTHWAAVVSGPPGSGKTHLADVWRTRSKAEVVAASELSDAVFARFAANTALAVEDLDRGIGDERVLFHLLNLAREHKLSILLTSRAAPGDLTISLPDLRSRLRAVPHVVIAAPDEPLLSALLVKLFADRQLTVEPHVLAHIITRMERSTEAAVGIVDAIDRLALASHRKVTRALAAEALDRIGEVET